jgi:IS5 family transposase
MPEIRGRTRVELHWPKSKRQARANHRGVEHPKASVRAKVEHTFRVIKRRFGHTKVRHRGLAKNTAQLHTLFALTTLWMVRKQLLAPDGEVRPLRAKAV